MSAKLDPRLNAYRPDLADARLEGKVKAARYVAGEVRQVASPSVALRARPSLSEGLENEVLFGERVRVFDADDAWAWCQLERDGYVGYIAAESLTREVLVPTHRVSALGTFVYPEPDIKSAPLMHLSINADLTVAGQQDRFLNLATGGWVISRHASEIGRFALDFVEIAERFIGTPYLWGGRTRLGVDCSGLLQIALEAAGQSCPRDTDMQQRSVGAELIVRSDLDGLRRGDLVFWPRHVGIMVDGVMMLHANAHHMAVAVEPLADAVERTARLGGRITCMRRPSAREPQRVG
jgi:cell wall-associated NlpC family hydrolase